MTVDPKVFINTFLSVREGVRAGTITDPVVLTLFAMVEEANEAVCWGVDCVHEARVMDMLASNSKDMMSRKEMRLVWTALLHHAAVIKEDDGTRANLLAWLHKMLSGEEGLHGSELQGLHLAHFGLSHFRNHPCHRQRDSRRGEGPNRGFQAVQVRWGQAVSRANRRRRYRLRRFLRRFEELATSVLNMRISETPLLDSETPYRGY